ncbi:HNH endonuclease [Nonomuraea sp. NPDC051941]|uniref:HNH endonuclease n=1 Tax=Nonomuraea sp. NPDC051941 TaxID=3364373 RepID=UPI0037C723A8
MTAGRPAIPSELRRRVLIEAGHRCAIPTCRATPVEIAHIIPWSKVKKHEFKNLIALCPTCHARYDDPHNPLDRKAVRQYKVNLNPLLSSTFGAAADCISLIAAYQGFRTAFGAWVRGELEYAAAKARVRSIAADPTAQGKPDGGPFADALCALLDFQSAWGRDAEVSEVAGAILMHVAEWSDEVRGAPCPVPEALACRDITEELAEVSSRLHLLVCEEAGILASEESPVQNFAW